MKARLRRVWSDLMDSLWFVPAQMTVAAALLAVALMALEGDGALWEGHPPWWVYGGTAEAARNVLDSITGSLITVTGVLFSVTIVAVQLASSQYTPRLLRNFTSDRGNQRVLGLFIATFTYGLLVLRSIRDAQAPRGEFVPRLAITVAIGLLLVCVAALIYFINHVANEIRITSILERITRETKRNVRQLFPEHVGRAADRPHPDPRKREHPSALVSARTAGYVQMVDQATLFKIGREERVVIGMEPRIGDYVLEGRPLASVWTEAPLGESMEDEIRRAFVLGPERKPEQDVQFGMIQISDIAIKALSPSVNDPTTAIRCIDRLSEILSELGRREPPEAQRTRDGRIHFLATYTTFSEAVAVSYDDIRHFGAKIPLIVEQLIHALADLLALVPEECREPLVDQARAVLHAGRREIENPRDRAAIERTARRLAEWMDIDDASSRREGG